MEELFQKLLEAEILTEDVKTELQAAYTEQLNEAIESSKKEAGEQVRAELTEQWVTERDVLIEAVDNQVGEFLNTELNELKEDINRFRDLEAEYAERIVEEKSKMATVLESDMVELVEKIDAFLEIRLNSELEELKEDINQVKKLEFGKDLFEGFVTEYRKNFVDDDGIEAELRETREQAVRTAKKLEEAEKQLDEQARSVKMTELLQPLAGKERDVMEALLHKLPTEQLGEGYKAFIGRVIKNSVVKETEEKESPVLAEASEEKPVKIDEKEELKVEGKVITGDIIKESNEPAKKEVEVITESESIRKLKSLAGITE